MASILVIDPNSFQAHSMIRHLSLAGHAITSCEDFTGLDTILSEFPVDHAVISLIHSGDEDTLAVVARLRALYRMGIVLLLQGDDLDEKVLALRAGADICLDHPRDPRELEAAVLSLDRRLFPARHGFDLEAATIEAAAWDFDETHWSLTTPQGCNVILTSAEYRVVTALSWNHGEPVTRYEIASALGKVMGGYDDRCIDAIIARLRRKVVTESGEELPIRAIRGIGYVFAGTCRFTGAYSSLSA